MTFNFETSGKKFAMVFTGVFKTQSNIYDGAFLGKQLKIVNYFRKKTSQQMFDWVLNTPLVLTIKFILYKVGLQKK